jgi:hypothetical protein
MLKHFAKTKSLKCRFRTGDVAYLLGRPFMLRVNPLFASKKTTKGTRTRANVKASMHSDFSVIDLFVPHVGNYDHGRTSFMSLAHPIFAQNIPSLLKQSMTRVFPEVAAITQVKYRPMRDTWVNIDEAHGIVWFSDSLIPYPANAVVYAYLVEAIKHYASEADDQERQALLAKGVPNWQEMKALLADPNNRYEL